MTLFFATLLVFLTSKIDKRQWKSVEKNVPFLKNALSATAFYRRCFVRCVELTHEDVVGSNYLQYLIGFSKLKLILCEIIAPQCKFEFIKILVPLCAPCVLSEEIVKLLTIILPSFYCSPKKAIFSLFQAKMSSDQHGLGMQKGKILNDKYISNFSCGVLRYLTPCYCYVLCTLSTYWVLDYAFALNILIVYIFSSCYA